MPDEKELVAIKISSLVLGTAHKKAMNIYNELLTIYFNEYNSVKMK